MEHVRARGDDDVHHPVLNQVANYVPHTRRHHRTREAEEDRHLVFEHLSPNARCRGKVARLKGCARHALDDLGGAELLPHDERVDVRVEKRLVPARMHRRRPLLGVILVRRR